MTETFVAVVVAVPYEHFSDDDDICLAAGNFVCAKLESHLMQHGHSIPGWVQGGCDEDWGVYFESTLDETRFQYSIGIFSCPPETPDHQMLVQYRQRLPFLKRLLRKPDDLSPDHPMHETMRSFGDLFGTSRMLTRSQFEKEY